MKKKYEVDHKKSVVRIKATSIKSLTAEQMKEINNLIALGYTRQVISTEKKTNNKVISKSADEYKNMLKDKSAELKQFEKLLNNKYTGNLKGEKFISQKTGEPQTKKMYAYAAKYANLILDGKEEQAAEYLKELDKIKA
jgi:hypothetical protein